MSTSDTSAPGASGTLGRPGPGTGSPTMRAHVADVLVVLGAFAVMGVLGGLLWERLVDPPLLTRVAQGTSTDEVQLGREFGIDGWYTVVGAAAGFLLGLLLLVWRSRRPVEVLALVLAGSGLAAWLAARTGVAVGPADPAEVLAEAAVGTRAPQRLGVTAAACYLAWPIGASLGALLALWRPRPRGTHRSS